MACVIFFCLIPSLSGHIELICPSVVCLCVKKSDRKNEGVLHDTSFYKQFRIKKSNPPCGFGVERTASVPKVDTINCLTGINVSQLIHDGAKLCDPAVFCLWCVTPGYDQTLQLREIMVFH